MREKSSQASVRAGCRCDSKFALPGLPKRPQRAKGITGTKQDVPKPRANGGVGPTAEGSFFLEQLSANGSIANDIAFDGIQHCIRCCFSQEWAKSWPKNTSDVGPGRPKETPHDPIDERGMSVPGTHSVLRCH